MVSGERIFKAFDRLEVEIGQGRLVYMSLNDMLVLASLSPLLSSMHRFVQGERTAGSPRPLSPRWWGRKRDVVQALCILSVIQTARLSLKHLPNHSHFLHPSYQTQNTQLSRPLITLQLDTNPSIPTHPINTQHRQYGQSRCGVPNKHLHAHPVTAR